MRRPPVAHGVLSSRDIYTYDTKVNNQRLTYCFINPISQVLLQRKKLPRLRIQDLLPVKVFVVGARRLRSQRAVRPLEAAAHLPVDDDVPVPHQPLLLLAPLEVVPHVLEGIGPLERVEDAVEVAAEGPVEGRLDGGRHRPPGGAVADGRGPASVVRHG